MPARRRKKTNLLPTLLAGTAIIGAVATAMLAAFAGQAPGLDENGCRLENPPMGELVVFLDQTDPLSENQRKAAREIVDGRIAEARAGDRIAVFGLNSHFDGVATPLFQVCRPARRAKEAGTGATDKYLENRWKPFQAKVDATIDQMTEGNIAPTSPIFEALRAIASTPDFRASTRRDLVVISDGLENTPGWPEARNATARFIGLGAGDYPRSLTADLRSTHLTLYWLAREAPEGHLETPGQRAFFSDWITAQGAVIDASNSLPL